MYYRHPTPYGQISAEQAAKIKAAQGSDLGKLYMLATPVAWAVSYSRNQSVGWALLHGLISVPYLIYAGIQEAKK